MTENYRLEITRLLNASPQEAFEAWTDPEKLRRWWGPEGMTASHVELDPRPGGFWRTCMKSDADGTEYWVQGTYREVTPPERLVFTWAWENDGTPGHVSQVTIEFRAKDGKTEMIFVHEGFESAESRDNHQDGWASSFVCLEMLFA